MMNFLFYLVLLCFASPLFSLISDQIPRSPSDYQLLAKTRWSPFQTVNPYKHSEDEKPVDIFRVVENEKSVHVFQVWNRLDTLCAKARANAGKILVVYLETLVIPSMRGNDTCGVANDQLNIYTSKIYYHGASKNHSSNIFVIGEDGINWGLAKSMPYSFETWLLNLEFAADYSVYAYGIDVFPLILDLYKNILKVSNDEIDNNEQGLLRAIAGRVQVKINRLKQNQDIVDGDSWNFAPILKSTHFSESLNEQYKSLALELPRDLQVHDDSFVHQIIRYVDLAATRNIKKQTLTINGYLRQWSQYSNNLQNLNKEMEGFWNEIANAETSWSSASNEFHDALEKLNHRPEEKCRIAGTFFTGIVKPVCDLSKDIGKMIVPEAGAEEAVGEEASAAEESVGEDISEDISEDIGGDTEKKGKDEGAEPLEILEHGEELIKGIGEFSDKLHEFHKNIPYIKPEFGTFHALNENMRSMGSDILDKMLKKSAKDLTINDALAVLGTLMIKYPKINGGQEYDYHEIYNMSEVNPQIALMTLAKIEGIVAKACQNPEDMLNSMKLEDSKLNDDVNKHWTAASDAYLIIKSRLQGCASNRKRYFEDMAKIAELQAQISDAILEMKNFQNQQQVIRSAQKQEMNIENLKEMATCFQKSTYLQNVLHIKSLARNLRNSISFELLIQKDAEINTLLNKLIQATEPLSINNLVPKVINSYYSLKYSSRNTDDSLLQSLKKTYVICSGEQVSDQLCDFVEKDFFKQLKLYGRATWRHNLPGYHQISWRRERVYSVAVSLPESEQFLSNKDQSVVFEVALESSNRESYLLPVVDSKINVSYERPFGVQASLISFENKRYKIFESDFRTFDNMKDHANVSEPDWVNICDPNVYTCFSPYTNWTLVAGANLRKLPEFQHISVIAIHMEALTLDLGPRVVRDIKSQRRRKPFNPYASLIKDKVTSKIRDQETVDGRSFIGGTIVIATFGLITFISYKIMKNNL